MSGVIPRKLELVDDDEGNNNNEGTNSQPISSYLKSSSISEAPRLAACLQKKIEEVVKDRNPDLKQAMDEADDADVLKKAEEAYNQSLSEGADKGVQALLLKKVLAKNEAFVHQNFPNSFPDLFDDDDLA